MKSVVSGVTTMDWRTQNRSLSGQPGASERRRGISVTSASALEHFPIFQGMAREDLTRIAFCLKPKAIQKGAMLALESHLAERVCFAYSGRYRLMMTSPNGTYVSIRTIEAGEHFGELWLFAAGHHPNYHLLADTDGVLLVMSARNARALSESMPSFARALTNSLAQTAITHANRIYELTCLPVRARLQAELLRLADRSRRGDGALIEPAPTHAAIASQIGATREEVSRQLRSLVMSGLIESRRGSIFISNVARLRSEVETGYVSQRAVGLLDQSMQRRAGDI